MDSRTGTTPGGIVVGGPEHPTRSARYTPFIAVAIVLTTIFVWGATTFKVPYYAIAPGSAVDTAPLVVVSDASRYHDPDGKILLTTVSLGKVTLVEAIEGWLNPAVDVVKERLIAPPDIDENELREINLRDMEESKNKALGVAFEQLGVDAISGSGAEIVEVVDGTPAEGTITAGETIVAVDGAPVSVDIDAIDLLGAHRPGDSVTLRIQPADGTAPRETTVTLTRHPEDAERAFLGVRLSTKDLRFSFPFPVEVRSERIGGPSAGLAFTLEIIDVLTEGELTGGRLVATTGTIELDGSVGQVGGVAQKTVAVRASGADLFLVPAAEAEIARRFAGDDLRIEPVDDLEDALRVLATVGGNGLALPPLAPAEPQT